MRDNALALLDLIGLRPQWIDMPDDALMLDDFGIILLRQGLTDEALEDVADQALSRAAASLSEPVTESDAPV